MLNPVGIHAVGLIGPGLTDFPSAREILAGREDHLYAPVQIPPTSLLPANERRRTTQTIRLALHAAEEASEGGDRASMRSVFASSSGDMDIIDRICETLTQPDPAVSPMQFHNSVHNAPAGNWSIATRNPAPATALSGFTGTVAAGLLEAVTLQLAEGGEVLLVCYDVPSMELFREVRPVHEHFAFGLRLGPVAGAPWRLRLEPRPQAAETRCRADALEALRDTNPAARCLPLLERLAGAHTQEVVLEAPAGRSLAVHVEESAEDTP